MVSAYIGKPHVAWTSIALGLLCAVAVGQEFFCDGTHGVSLGDCLGDPALFCTVVGSDSEYLRCNKNGEITYWNFPTKHRFECRTGGDPFNNLCEQFEDTCGMLVVCGPGFYEVWDPVMLDWSRVCNHTILYDSSGEPSYATTTSTEQLDCEAPTA
jgi:hypothetical protein